jgi:hypothetical protein
MRWTTHNDTDYNTKMDDNSLVAGAVDLTTGNYFFGGFDMYSWEGTVHFDVFMYSPSTGKYSQVGHFDTGLKPHTSSQVAYFNGDMAFDSNGNLYVLRSAGGKGTTNLYSITAQEVRDAATHPNSLNELEAQELAQGKIDVSGINGAAFGGDGSLYLSNETNLYRYDANTWKLLGQYRDVVDDGTDLASCNSPSTISLEKNLPDGRIAESDQFTISLIQSNGTAYSATTQGSDTGQQDAVVGPVPAMQGTTFTIGETMAKGSVSRLDDYTTTWRCDDGSGTVATGDLSAGHTTVSIQKAGSALTCHLTNAITGTGSLTWSKHEESAAGPDTTNLLGGSKWSFVGGTVGEAEATFTVSDCESAPCPMSSSASELADMDPAPGQFRIDNLPFGTYILNEIEAPKGYQIAASPTRVIVSGSVAGGTAIDVGAFEDSMVPPARVSVSKTVHDIFGHDVSGTSANWTMNVQLAVPTAGIEITPNATRDTHYPGRTGQGPTATTLPWTVSFPGNSTATALKVSEILTGARADAYDVTSMTCARQDGTDIDVSKPTVTQSTTADGSTVTMVSVTTAPTVASGDAITCSVVNQQRPGTVEWEKRMDNAAGTLLGGSSWTFTHLASGTEFTVEDNEGQAQYTGRDSDPTPGAFHVKNLAWGQYSVTEKAAPLGYATLEETETFTISATNLHDKRVFPVLNHQSEVPALPLTGGMASKDGLTILGLGVMVVSAAILGGYVVMRYRRRDAGRQRPPNNPTV